MARPLESKLGMISSGSWVQASAKPLPATSPKKGCSFLLNFASESSHSRAKELCASLAITHSIHCVAVQADLLSGQEAVATILAVAKQHFTSPTGTFQIDILINKAGVSNDRRLNDPTNGAIDADCFHWHYAINVLAPILTQACAPYLSHDRSDRIINMSSVVSSLGFEDQFPQRNHCKLLKTIRY